MSKRSYIALICSLALSAFFLITVSSDKEREQETANKTYYTPQDFIAPLPTCTPITPSPTPTLSPMVDNYYRVWRAAFDSVTLTEVELELEPIGVYYITAYWPQELGYNGSNFPKGWVTASDIICHRASYYNRYTEPTTCAVDPRLYNIGEDGDLFYIAELDRVFIAEDTGSAVKNKHIDIFYEEDASDFATGYYEVYSVSYNYYEVRAETYNVWRRFNTRAVDKGPIKVI